MRVRVRVRVMALVAMLIVASVMVATRPAAAGADRPFTDRYCQAFTEYFTASLIVQFNASLASAFSQLPEEDGSEPEGADFEEVRATFFVMLSPKFEELARQLTRGGPANLRSEFRKQRRVFARGVAILEEEGLTPEQIDLIAGIAVNQGSFTFEDLTDEIEISDNDASRLGRLFMAEVEKLQLQDPLDDVAPAFERAASECGAVPSQTLECDDVFSQADAAEIVGRDVTIDDAEGCRYVGIEEGVDVAPEVAVVVYETDLAFDTLTEAVPAEPVDGIGEQAASFEGFSASGKERFCGRTLVVASEGRTVVTALCPSGEEPVTDDDLVAIADGVLQRLADLRADRDGEEASARE